MAIARARRLVPSVVMGLFMLAVSDAPRAAPASANASEGERVSTFTLENGLRAVVVPDRRAPVVTHMVWYKAGAGDEPKGVSGIAHFLEHLMFKSTEKIAIGEFSKIIARLGGQDNAFTSHDATSYFQRIAKDRLPAVMEMEADRMVNLRLTEKEVLTEREVILEERRSRIENNPAALLDEQMDAMLYLAHPYHIPIIGWEHEMAKLSREDALTFYKSHYAPNNALLVVAGDVTQDEVRRMAEATYGKIPANPDVKSERVRPSEPPRRAARRVELKDARAGNASFHRAYFVPSYVTAAPGEAEALEVLMKIAGAGATSRLYRKLVVEDKLASSSGGWYEGSGLDSGKIALYAVAANGAPLDKIEASIDGVLEDIRAKGVTGAELERAKSSLVADYVYESDNQGSLARRYGWNMVVGRTLAEVDGWPDAISKVAAEDVQAAARKFLDIRASVTGTLIPEDGDEGPSAAAPSSGPQDTLTLVR